ncbi:hypothetical protein C8J56DRAFT_315513 [Mycena floridula]|nr:hypothetical protein C8J56DRAFT_315513 [Mycena floridula]
MANETGKARAKLTNLALSLDELEHGLQPLLSVPLAESLLTLEPIQQAKLQTLLPYLVYDLVFIYLKSKGVDPKTHAVVPELDRVRQYFEKIKHAETPEPNRATTIDKEAAGRFIKHAITQAKQQQQQKADEPPSPGPSSVRAKVTSKMLEREQYQREMKQRDLEEGSEESDLEVFDGSDRESNASKRPSQTDDIADSSGSARPKKKQKKQKGRHDRSDAPTPSPSIASNSMRLRTPSRLTPVLEMNTPKPKKSKKDRRP